MPIRDHRGLIGWLLADKLRALIFELTETGHASRDRRFRDQIRDAISAVCRNLAEGFYCYDHPDFARFTRYSRASLGETQDLIRDGRQRGYWDEQAINQMLSLAKRAMVAISRLRRYLRTTTAPGRPRTQGTRRT